MSLPLAFKATCKNILIHMMQDFSHDTRKWQLKVASVATRTPEQIQGRRMPDPSKLSAGANTWSIDVCQAVRKAFLRMLVTFHVRHHRLR